MAEKPEDQFNDEDKIARAKEIYAIGCRNYYVRKYSDAADDLSEASKLFGEVYGIDGAELGDVYLMYAKALIAIGQEENKLIDVPEEEEDGEGEGEVEGGEEEPADEDNNADEGGEEKAETSETNGHSGNEPEAGPSKVAGEEGEEADGENDEEEGGNLEVAWEVLQNAANIFERVGGNKLKGLMDAYIEMAGISLENGNFDASLNDFNRGLAVFEDLDEADQNQRVAAEVHYKIGLCHMMEKRYDESMKSFQKAADIIEEVINREKAREDQTEEDKLKIKDLEETQQELINKISEVKDTKAEELEFVKREMLKMYGPSGAMSSSDGAGTSSSAAAESSSGGSSLKSPLKSSSQSEARPTDISHLIKRKKPDSDPVQESPAKKQILETSPGEKIAVGSDKVAADDEAPKVQVVEN